MSFFIHWREVICRRHKISDCTRKISRMFLEYSPKVVYWETESRWGEIPFPPILTDHSDEGGPDPFHEELWQTEVRETDTLVSGWICVPIFSLKKAIAQCDGSSWQSGGLLKPRSLRPKKKTPKVKNEERKKYAYKLLLKTCPNCHIKKKVDIKSVTKHNLCYPAPLQITEIYQ